MANSNRFQFTPVTPVKHTPTSSQTDQDSWSDLFLLPYRIAADCYVSLSSTGTAPSVTQVAIGVAGVAVATATVKSLWTMTSWRRKLRNSKTDDPAPGPTPLPLMGNTLQLQSAYFETLYRYVDIPASVFWVLSTPFVVVNDEQGLRRVLGGASGTYTKPKYFGYRSRAVTSAVQAEQNRVASESIEYAPNGDTSRVALEQLVKEAIPEMKNAAHVMLREMERVSNPTDTHPTQRDVSLQAVRIVRKTIVNLNLRILFGVHDSEDPGRIADMIEFAGTEFAQRMVNPLKVFIDWIANVRFIRDVSGLISLGRRLCQALDDAVEKAEGQTAAGVSWVHAWVGKVGRIGKLGKVVGLLMASTQTVPLTAVWMLHLVANNKDVQDKVRAELETLGLQSVMDLNYEHLDQMPFTDAVIKETLRLYPPFPLIQRQAQKEDVLGEVTIPEGTIVYVVPWLVHRNGKYFQDAHDFKPQRFLQGSASHGDAPSDWVYIPFGRGARMCAGSRLAIAELKVLLCHAVLGFKWSSWKEDAKTDERFPALGMVPRGVRMEFGSDEKTRALDALLTMDR